MATTHTTDLINPEVLAETVTTGFAGMQILNGTPAAVVAQGLPGDLRGGDTVRVPRFANIGELEDVDEGEALTPAKLSMTADETTVQRAGKAFSITEWARLAAAYADPYAEAARQIVEGVARRADKALLDAALKPGADLLTLDISAMSGGAAKLSWDAIVDAKQLWGDEQDDIVMLASNSATLGSLYKLRDGTGKPLLSDAVNGGLPSFMGIPLKVSDRIAPAGDVHTTLLLKRSSLALWYANSPSVAVDVNILTDETIAAINVYFAALRYSKMPGGTKSGVVCIKHK